jgi:hypothetical protein
MMRLRSASAIVVSLLVSAATALRRQRAVSLPGSTIDQTPRHNLAAVPPFVP